MTVDVYAVGTITDTCDDRFEHDRIALRKRVANAHAGRRLERLFARIDVVILTVVERDVQVGDRMAARAVQQRFAHALFDGRE